MLLQMKNLWKENPFIIMKQTGIFLVMKQTSIHSKGRDMKRKIRILFLFLCIMVLALSSFACQKKAVEEERPVYYDFRDIPGVTEAEIAEIEALQAAYPTLEYGMLNTTETFHYEDGTYGGYSKLFCEWMTSLFGITFTPHIYDWNTLITGFEAGTIDFTGELTTTPERLQKYYMTDAFTERAIKAFRVKGSESFIEIAKTRPLRFAYLNGTTTEDLVLSSLQYEIEGSFVDTEQEAMEALYAGEIDAFLGEEHSGAAFDMGIVGEDVFPVIYSPVSFATANEALAPIVRVFNKYLKNGAFYHLVELYNEGAQEYEVYKLHTLLTPEEKAFIQEKREKEAPIYLLAETDTYPSSFYNKQEKEWQGIALDVLEEISLLTGLEFRIVNAADADWPILFAMLESGEGEMITELIFSSERENRFLWTDAPYSVDHYALLSLNTHEDIGINQVLYSRIGLIEGSAYAEVFKEWFPDHTNTITYINPDEGFAALERGEIDLLMATRNLLLSATNYLENPVFKANFVFDRTYESSFGFHIDEAILASIVSKAQNFVKTEEITERWTRKTFDYRGKVARAQIPYLAGVSILLICVIGLLVVLFVRNRNMNKRLEQTVRERTAELETQTEMANEASQAKGEFLSRMSHEIRTPLNAIVGMLQIAQGTKDYEKIEDALQKAEDNSKHLINIINEILDYSRIESNRIVLDERPFSLVKNLEFVMSMFEEQAREKGIALRLEIHALQDEGILADVLRLNQVLINLLSNALKFTDADGQILLAVEEFPRIGEKKNVYQFQVKDTGIGISEKQVARLFSPFMQADETITRSYGGTGLGLAISKRIVELMGGEIGVTSTLGEGSTFGFTIKAEAVPIEEIMEEEKEEHHLQEEKPDFTGKRLLVVDDIEINREIVIALLQGTNIETESAANGKEAVALFEAMPAGCFDMVFMDMQMPVMDGCTAAEAMRASEKEDAKTIKIVAMTANVMQEDVRRVQEAGMDGHIGKPLDIQELYQVIQKMLYTA
jgi:signal transduction histidine kinase